jgi:intracellular multiplication protein IcmK
MCSIAFGCFAANKDEDAQQALQQLRLLQQKLSQNPGQDSQGIIEGITAEVPPNNASANPGSQAAASNNAAQNPSGKNTKTQSSSGGDNQVITQNETEIIDNKSFKDMTRSLYPLNPEQVVRLKQIYQTQEYAQASTPGTPPKPTATSQFVNLSPGSTPPVIRLSQGFVSSLVFLDSTGAPWPISAYDLGDPSAFNIQWDKTSNTLMIQAMKLYNYGNLAVRLRGLNTPVMLTLIPGQKAVDYRVDLRVQGYGPNAKSMPMEEGIPPSASDILLHVLDGVPPAGSSRLVVSGGDARAWLSNNKMYVRTNLTILSPGWLASMTSADGTHAYEMQKSPVLLVSWHGKVMQLKVEGL